MAACVSSWGREVKRVCKHSPYQSPPPPVFDTLGSERNSEGAYGEKNGNDMQANGVTEMDPRCGRSTGEA